MKQHIWTLWVCVLCWLVQCVRRCVGWCNVSDGVLAGAVCQTMCWLVQCVRRCVDWCSVSDDVLTGAVCQTVC